MASSSTSTSSDDRFTHCFQSWMAQQEHDLQEFLQAITNQNNDDQNLRRLIETSLNHFEEHTEKRKHLARCNAPLLFSPTWTSAFENSYLWIAGCRPSLYIRLVYSLCCSGSESQLTEFLQQGHMSRGSNMGELSARQVRLVNELHCRTVKEEERQTSRLASLQERMADQEFVVMANEYWSGRSESSEATRSDGGGGGVRRVLEEQSAALAEVVEKADKLRMETLREVMEILTPLQGVEFLVSSNKLHLSVHEWCKTRDHHHPQ